MVATCHICDSSSMGHRLLCLLYICVRSFTRFIYFRAQTAKAQVMSTNSSVKNFLPGKQSRRKSGKGSPSSSTSGTCTDMQDDLMVYISRRTILEAVGSAIKQDVQGYLHCDYLNGTIQASVHKAVPCHPGIINENPVVFKGEPAATQDEAGEGAAQAALDYICNNYNVIINDFSYHMLQVTKDKLFTAQDKIRTKQWQFNMARQEVTTQRAEFARQTEILARICDDFSDVVSLRMYPQRPHTEDRIISYTGGRPPVGRLQHFAKAYYHFIIGTNPAGGYTRMI